ncbi:hypothetical protein [Chitinivorax sp. B]|uniref:hypothetical protein n=1 Tax=Chitinivorax sp. B TaxID=2502235 RepID=UPI0010F50EAC|nr:hypothetical protein [Chitinivorax sp. B]
MLGFVTIQLGIPLSITHTDMYTIVRFFLLVVLTISLPFAGRADARAVTDACPMLSMGAPVQLDAGQASCCNDLATAQKTGHPCKVGQDCKAGSATQAIELMTGSPVLGSTPLVQTLSHPLSSADLAGCWRPPRSL